MKKRTLTGKSVANKIKRVEYDGLYGHTLHCLFCGAEVFGDEELLNPCDHLLFVAHDEGFSYRSKRLDEMMGWTDLEDEDIIGRKSWDFDKLTDSISGSNSIKFVFREGPPTCGGYYIGLSPVESD